MEYNKKIKMKTLLVLLFIYFPFLCTNVFATCPVDNYESCGTNCYSVCDCSYVKVSATIAAASANSTINVPAGSCTWTSTLTITKGINLIGAGIGNTVITNATNGGLGYNGNHCWAYNPSNYDLNTPFRISGFSINLGGTAGWLYLGKDSKKAPFTIQTNVRIDHNRIYNPGDSIAASMIWTTGTMYGVIDHNIFEGAYYAFKSDPQITDSSGWYMTSPQKDFEFGSDKYMYWENNTISLTTSDNLLVESQYGGRYVFRYNTITGAASYSLFEMHGHQSGMPSSFGGEIYGNQISGGFTLHKTRGGKSMVYYNSIGGGPNNAAYTSLVVCPTEAPEMQMIHDTYWFRNRADYIGKLTSTDVSGSITCAGRDGIPMLGRDIISDSSSPGVGCGTLANIPLTCTTGQAYWATTQSCTNLTDMVGANPTTLLSGTMYKCTAPDTWTFYYTPYSYPHPLTNVPSPPTLLQ